MLLALSAFIVGASQALAQRRLGKPSLISLRDESAAATVLCCYSTSKNFAGQTSKFERYCCTHDSIRYGVTHVEIAKSATVRGSEPTKLKQTVRNQRGKARSVAGSRRPADCHTGCPLGFAQPHSQPAARDLARGKIASDFNGSLQNVLVGGAAPTPTLLLCGSAIATLTVEGT